MDMGNGRMQEVTPEFLTKLGVAQKGFIADDKIKAIVLEKTGGLSIFEVGEVVGIKNSKFKIKTIGENFMELELLPR